MAVTTFVKSCVNQCLKHVNLRLDTLTAERIEDARLDTLAQSGYFERQVVPIPSAFRSSAFDLILRHVAAHAERFDDFEDPSRNGVMYSYDTDYFTSPDTEVLYSVIREVRPPMFESVQNGFPKSETLFVYKRAGTPCSRCQTLIQARGQGDDNRTTYWCPACQR